MTLPLTPHVLVAAYKYLRVTAPFRRWALPPADEVEFSVTRHRDREGDHEMRRRKEHVIRVSAHKITTTDLLMQVMAHEMLHAYQDGVLRSGGRVAHNAKFHQLARWVCKRHGWDEAVFVGEE